MRLTADLINSSLSYLNPLNERELDLRGNRIPLLENLGTAKDHDALDLTDNDIPTLSNFPLLPRLRTLLLARNRIATLHPSLARSIPNLSTLVLAGNRVRELADLDPLGAFAALTHLVLLENPVCAKEYYRYWVLWRCPSVRYLDYQKVKDAERKRAVELFGSADAPTALASKILHIKSHTFDVPSSSSTTTTSSATAANGRLRLSDKERKRIEALIRNAGTMAEITQLEKFLAEGRLPPGVGDGEMDG